MVRVSFVRLPELALLKGTPILVSEIWRQGQESRQQPIHSLTNSLTALATDHTMVLILITLVVLRLSSRSGVLLNFKMLRPASFLSTSSMQN